MITQRQTVPPCGQERCPDYQCWDKQRGRLEQRQLWVLEAKELGLYLEQEWHWPGVRQVGWIRRRRIERTSKEQQTKTTTWISSLSPQQASPERLAALMRGHWLIENRLHRVRDVSQSEDLLHGRHIGLALATIWTLVLNLARLLHFALLPDAYRYWRRYPALALALVTAPL